MSKDALDGLSEHDLAEFRINRIRQDISAMLHELADEDAPHLRWLALKRLVGAAIEACTCVAVAGRENPELAKALSAELTHWPVLYSVFPGEPDALAEYIRRLGLGSAAPLAVRRKWRLKAPGTVWAHAYWQLVNESQAYYRIFGMFPATQDGWVWLLRGKVLLKDAEDAVALPPLARNARVLAEWKAAYSRHLERHFPGVSALDRPEWQRYFSKTRLDSIGKRKAKLLEAVAHGFAVLAPQA